MPKPNGVLLAEDRDLYDLGKCLHTPLLILCGRTGSPGAVGTGRAAAGGGSRTATRLATRRDHLGDARRLAGRRG